MEPKYQTPEQALSALKRYFTRESEIASFLDVNQAHVYNYYNNRRRISPTLVRSLRELELIPRRIRSQITWETQEQKDAFEWYVKSLGCSSISEYCRDIANSNMEAFENGKNEYL